MAEDSIDRMVGEWAKTAPDLDVGVFQVIGRLLLAAAHCQHVIVAALRPVGLSYGDFDVLNTLRRRGDPDGTNPRELAQSALITSGAMTARLDRLERSGLIERGLDPSDRRGVLIRLTERGTQVAMAALDAVIAADDEFLSPLDEKQRDSLAEVLKLLVLRHETS